MVLISTYVIIKMPFSKQDVAVLVWLMKLHLTTYKKGIEPYVFFPTEIKKAFKDSVSDDDAIRLTELYRFLEGTGFNDEAFEARYGYQHGIQYGHQMIVGQNSTHELLALLRELKLHHFEGMLKPYGADANRIMTPLSQFLATKDMLAPVPFPQQPKYELPYLPMPEVPRFPFFRFYTIDKVFQEMLALRDAGKKIPCSPAGIYMARDQDMLHDRILPVLQEKYSLSDQQIMEILDMWCQGVQTLEMIYERRPRTPGNCSVA